MALLTITQLVSPRALIRPVCPDDLQDLLHINGDDRVTQFLPYATWQGLGDAQAWLARMQTMASTGLAQQLVIERLRDHKVIGTALLFKFDEGSARVELGYVMGHAFWRQGYAKEALGALCEHAFARLSIRRIEAEVNPDNHASNALLLKLGFVHEGRLRQRWVAKGRAYDTNLYGRLVGDKGVS
jgi:[ribosomal protein S5]-alanine N-acetyltransferase